MSSGKVNYRYNIRCSTLGLWGLFLILTFFVGFRWDVGIDWPSYMDLFGENLSSTINLMERIEVGNLAVKFLLLFNGYEDGGYYLWVMAFITMFFIFYSIQQYSISPFLSIALFVFLGMYFDLMNGVRQYAAVALSVFSWQFIFEKKILHYFISILVAYLFHSSALVMLPLYFLCTKTFDKNFLIVMAIISIPLSYIIAPVSGKIMGLFPQYDIYENSQFANANNPLSILRIFYPLSVFIMLIMKYEKLIKDKKNHVLVNLSLFSIFCTFLFPSVSLMIRVGYYFQMAFVFIIPVICKNLSPKVRFEFKWFSLIYAIIYIYITQLSRPIANIFPFELNFRLADIQLIFILLVCFIISYIYIHILRFGIKK